MIIFDVLYKAVINSSQQASMYWMNVGPKRQLEERVGPKNKTLCLQEQSHPQNKYVTVRVSYWLPTLIEFQECQTTSATYTLKNQNFITDITSLFKLATKNVPVCQGLTFVPFPDWQLVFFVFVQPFLAVPAGQTIDASSYYFSISPLVEARCYVHYHSLLGYNPS